jgi:hypothetical protein
MLLLNARPLPAGGRSPCCNDEGENDHRSHRYPGPRSIVLTDNARYHAAVYQELADGFAARSVRYVRIPWYMPKTTSTGLRSGLYLGRASWSATRDAPRASSSTPCGSLNKLTTETFSLVRPCRRTVRRLPQDVQLRVVRGVVLREPATSHQDGGDRTRKMLANASYHERP